MHSEINRIQNGTGSQMTDAPKKKSTRFVKGNPGGPGRPKQPLEIQDAKQYMKNEFDRIVLKLSAMPIEELQAFIKAKQGTVLEMAMAACYFKAASTGNNNNIAFFMDRIVGKPKQQVELSGELNNRVTLNDGQLTQIADEISDGNKSE